MVIVIVWSLVDLVKELFREWSDLLDRQTFQRISGGDCTDLLQKIRELMETFPLLTFIGSYEDPDIVTVDPRRADGGDLSSTSGLLVGLAWIPALLRTIIGLVLVRVAMVCVPILPES